MGESTRIGGSCHCGNIRFRLRWPAAQAEIRIRECGCSFCRKHRGAWTSHPDAALDVDVGDPALVSKYRFGTKTAEFYVCAVCGCAALVLSEIDGRAYSVVNVNCFDDAAGFTFSRAATDFEGEDRDARLDRRKRNWIPSVRVESPAR